MSIEEYCTKQLKPSEELVRVVRRHPVVMVPAIIFGGLLLITDFFLTYLVDAISPMGVVGWGVVLLLSGFIISRGIYIWSHNAIVITSQRVIDIDQRGFFERHVAETAYDKIQDVRYTIRGIWSTIFQFGDVAIQTAGNSTNLEITSIRQPAQLQQLITDRQRQAVASTDQGRGPLKLNNIRAGEPHDIYLKPTKL